MRKYFIGIVANILHHYDRSLFGLLAPILATEFFPKINPVYALICTYLLLPLGAISKPLGALIFGYCGDKFGTKKTLSIILIGASISTVSIAFLPSYNEVGWFASVFLGIAQLARSFFSATQSTGAAIFVLEQTSLEKRCQVSSWFDSSGILGSFIGASATCLVHFYGISWRYLFLAAGLSGLVGFLINLKIHKTKKYLENKKSFSFKILLEHKRAVFAIAAVSGFSYANYYIVMTFMSSFLPLISNISNAQAISMHTFLLSFDFFLLPIMGYVATKIGKTYLMIYAISGIIISAIPLLMILNQATFFLACFVRIVFTFFGVCLAAPYHAWAIEVSPLEHRYLIGSVGVALGSRLIGAPIPALSFFLYYKTGLIFAPAIPLLLSGLLALLVMVPQRDVISQKESKIF